MRVVAACILIFTQLIFVGGEVPTNKNLRHVKNAKEDFEAEERRLDSCGGYNAPTYGSCPGCCVKSCSPRPGLGSDEKMCVCVEGPNCSPQDGGGGGPPPMEVPPYQAPLPTPDPTPRPVAPPTCNSGECDCITSQAACSGYDWCVWTPSPFGGSRGTCDFDY